MAGLLITIVVGVFLGMIMGFSKVMREAVSISRVQCDT